MKTPRLIEEKAGKILLAVRVKPRASRSRAAGVKNGVLELSVTAPPAQGQANRAAGALLAELLGVSRTRVELVSGAASRNKRFAVQGLSAEDVASRLGLQ